MNSVLNRPWGQRRKLSSLLGLVLDGSRLDGVVVRLQNGSLQAEHDFSTALSLDPLTNDAELVGREILNHIEAAGVRERHCVVALPLKWALAAHTKLPELPEADVDNFLQIEAERGFPCDVATLRVSISRYMGPSGEPYATFVGVPSAHVERLEQILHAARLKPVSLTLATAVLQPPGAESSNGVLALSIGNSSVGLQITCGGGVASLRALEGALETEGGERILNGELVAREARITLGQLPAEVRDAVKRIRIFGAHPLSQQLAAELRPRFEPAGLSKSFPATRRMNLA